MLTNLTVFPALLRASTADAWGTFTTLTSFTETIMSLTCRRPSVAAAPPGINFVIYMDVSVLKYEQNINVKHAN